MRVSSILLAFTLCLSIVAVSVSAVDPTSPPDLPYEFISYADVTMPVIGNIPHATIYYDYVNQRMRTDMSMFGAQSITLDLYGENAQYQISTFSGSSECEYSELDDDMPNFSSLPPADQLSFGGMMTIDGEECEEWNFNFLDVSWCLIRHNDKNATIKQFESKAVGTKMVFGSMTVGPVDPHFFDPTQFGCPDDPTTLATVSGYVKDAVTGRAISGASVSVDNKEATSNQNGVYNVEGVKIGATVSISASASGYIDSPDRDVVVNGNVAAGTSADINLSPVLKDGSVRFVLTWGAYPSDLDSYLIAPNNGGQVYYRSRSLSYKGASATLDRDDTSSFGPETVTRTAQTSGDGTWQYLVKIFSAGTSFKGAEVAMYSGANAPQIVQAPEDKAGKTWHVADITADGQFTVVNTIA